MLKFSFKSSSYDVDTKSTCYLCTIIRTFLALAATVMVRLNSVWLLPKETGSMSHQQKQWDKSINLWTCFWSFVTLKTAIYLNETFVSKLFCFRPTYVSLTLLMFVLVLVFPVLYFLLIKKRRSTALLAILAFYSFCHGLRSIFYE